VHGKPVLDRSQLTGTWRLSEVTAASGGGPAARPLGRAPQGLITYTADGWMSVVILPSRESGVPPICYAGRAELSDGSVSHVVEVGTAPYGAGTVQTRNARLDPAGHLLLTTPVGVVDPEATTLRWTKASASGSADARHNIHPEGTHHE
jgi:lipocalin-like protein